MYRRMHRTAVSLAMIAAGTVTISSILPAQRTAADSKESRTKSLVIGVNSITAQGIAITNEEIGINFRTGSGTGAGVMVGWGVNRFLTAFFSIDVAKQKSVVEDFDGDFGLVHGELGLRGNLAMGRSSTVPYVSVAAGARALGAKVTEPGVDEPYSLTWSGNLYSVGAGVEHSFSRSTALDAGVSLGFGKFDKVKADGQELPLPVDPTRSLRYRVGVTWRP
jgi:hypothetical protein